MTATSDTADTELLDELRATVRQACTSVGGVASARRLAEDSTTAIDTDAWRLLTEQIGVGCLGLPQRVGGIGGPDELVVVAEVLGESLLPVPFFSSTVLAGQVLAMCGAATDDVLADLASGGIAAVVGLTGACEFDPCASPLVMHDGRLSGQSGAVIGARGASSLVVLTADAVAVVDPSQPGCRISAIETLDLTRDAATVTFEDVACTIVSDDPARAADHALDVAMVVLAAEQLSGAQACLDATVAFVGERYQFGRAIGSFQSVKHQLADALVSVELARSAVTNALAAVHDDSGHQGAAAALIARIWCSDVYRSVSAEMIQLHGGVGFTWEHDAHLYFRRARSDAVLLGTATQCRARLAQILDW